MKNEAEVIAQNVTLILIQYFKAFGIFFLGVSIPLTVSINALLLGSNILVLTISFTIFILCTYISIQLWLVARLAEKIFKSNIKKVILDRKIAKAKANTK